MVLVDKGLPLWGAPAIRTGRFMKSQVLIRAQVQWQAYRSPTSDLWIGRCEAMDLWMEADSLDELHSLIDEAMTNLLAHLLRDNELEGYLSERGWESSRVDRSDDQPEVDFAVPWQLVAAQSRHDSSRAFDKRH